MSGSGISFPAPPTKACAHAYPRLDAPLEWACSSVVEHCVDIAGVASSILATPTIFFQ